MSKAIATKAARLLTEGKVKVQFMDGSRVLVEVQGDHDTYEVVRSGGLWGCPCPARVDVCAHIVAAAMVIPEWAGEIEVSLGGGDEEIDKLLEELS